jgi:lipopolysaccharide heptosyltransferase II
MKNLDSNSAKKILIVKPRAIGDVLLSTPVIENIKSLFPQWEIDFLCEKFAAPVVEGNPFLRNVITYNTKKDSTFSIIRRIRNNNYDIVIDLFGNPRTAMITRWSGAKTRIGFPFRGRAYAYTAHINPRGGEVHNVEFNLDALKYFDLPITSQKPLFPLSDKEIRFAEEYFMQNNLSSKKVIGINATGGWYAKRWKTGSFGKLITRISQSGNYEFLLFWGPGEYEDALAIQKETDTAVHVIPKTTLKEMGALLQRCSYLVSNDAGPMHVGAALDVPTLGIFGPTNPHLQGPYGERNVWVRNEELDCLGCNLMNCPIGNVCMTELSVDVVYSAFQKLIVKNKK